MKIPFFFLPVNKPRGWTSHDVVAHIRKITRKSYPKKTKVGHTGTLDPFASGLLLLAIGKATRFSDEVHLLPKTYRATMKLGAQTDTLDLDGTVTKEKDVPNFTQEDLAGMEKDFTGNLEQIPPRFSAKKIEGVRSYTLARRGEDVPLKPSQITVHSLNLTKLDDHHIQLEVNCSTGTYIRSLARDLAQQLGTFGYLTQLKRLQLGEISVDHAFAIDASPQTPSDPSVFVSSGLSVSGVLPSWPTVILPPEYHADLLHGRTIHSPHPLPKQFLGSIQQDSTIHAIFKCIYDPFLQVIHPKMLCYRRPAQKS